MADIGDTGWRPTKNVNADGTQDKANIDMPKAGEDRPCCMCRSWERDQKRLVEYLYAKGLVPTEDGQFTTPIAKDIPGRVPMKLDPKSHGWCRRDCIVTDMMATCPDWELVTRIEDLASRI